MCVRVCTCESSTPPHKTGWLGSSFPPQAPKNIYGNNNSSGARREALGLDEAQKGSYAGRMSRYPFGGSKGKPKEQKHPSCSGGVPKKGNTHETHSFVYFFKVSQNHLRRKITEGIQWRNSEHVYGWNYPLLIFICPGFELARLTRVGSRMPLVDNMPRMSAGFDNCWAGWGSQRKLFARRSTFAMHEHASVQ